ncbi:MULTISPECIES: TRAP transporter small permease [Fusobacterium]|uniref:TRAP transporter small permease n=1 Tax=Fusobacterium TaxID=848 RepID=UPI001476C26D|nr:MULTISPECIES: TRAP transporter small permease [Fusobacterium]NME35855.1 TRAP transporter small permease [Fusobacterium sp. FSA-380-WT-3A]
MRDFLKKFELYLGSIFIAITTIVVVMNVFTRYVLKFTYFWAEEIAVGCFVWTIFLGTAAAYREKALIGVEAIVVLLPKKVRKIVEFLVYILLFGLSSLMFYFSYTYVSSSSKITAALEISYAYINSSIIISFGLMSLYSLLFVIESFKKLIKDKE